MYEHMGTAVPVLTAGNPVSSAIPKPLGNKYRLGCLTP
jgi:hypothetical protein